jgi:methionyl aminopeptidase
MDARGDETVARRTPDEIALVREAGGIVHDVLAELVAAAVPGTSTAELDRIARARTRARGAEPAFLGYHGYPAAVCVSVNEEVVHGIPSAGRFLRDGDVVGIDFGAVYRGWYGDSAFTVAVGRVSEAARALLDATRGALAAAIRAALPGARLGDVGAAVQAHLQSRGFSVVREFVGHGIGRRLHEPPQVPNHGRAGRGLVLEPGMVLALEPMANAGRPEVRTLRDGWTAVTADGSLSAHYEHTVAIGENGPEILTFRSGGPWDGGGGPAG